MLMYIDSFDTYAAAQVGQRYSISGDAPLVGAYGRRSTNGIRLSTTAIGSYFERLVTAGAGFVVGFAYRLSSVSASAPPRVVGFIDSGSIQVDLRVQATTGLLQVTRNGTVLATASDHALLANTYYHLEFKATINDSTGSFHVRVNGETVGGLNLTGQDTQNTANASANTIRFWWPPVTAPVTADYDDLYICNLSGGSNNDFRGDCKVEAINPTAEGGYSEWTPLSGTDNALMVDDGASPDDDTTYVSSLTQNVRDTYVMGDLATVTGTVYGVQTVIRARKDDAGTRKVRPLFRRAGNDAQGAEATITDTYSTHLEVFETDPSDASAWTISKVNAAEIGEKLST